MTLIRLSLAMIATASWTPPSFCQTGVLPAQAWSGFVQCQVKMQGPGYLDQQTHTWTITAGTASQQGAMLVHPATWSVTGQGSAQQDHGGQAVDASWSTNVAPVSGPIAVFVRASDSRLIIKSWHSQLSVFNAMNGSVRSMGSGGSSNAQSIHRTVYELPFPTIEDVASSTQVSGSDTRVMPTLGSSMETPGTQGTLTCNWQFAKGGAAGASAGSSSGGTNSTGASPGGTAGNNPTNYGGPSNGSGNCTQATAGMNQSFDSMKANISTQYDQMIQQATTPAEVARLKEQKQSMLATLNSEEHRDEHSNGQGCSPGQGGTSGTTSGTQGSTATTQNSNPSGTSSGTQGTTSTAQNTNPTGVGTGMAASNGSSTGSQGSQTTVLPSGTKSQVAITQAQLPTAVTYPGGQAQALPATVATGLTGSSLNLQQKSLPQTAAKMAPISGNYLITVTGLLCVKPTLDDPLQFDGKGDEIYSATFVRQYARTSGAVVEYLLAQSFIYGDSGGNSGRINAGSLSPQGGITKGDFIPNATASQQRTLPAADRAFPMKLWQGVLTNGVDALVLSPSIWESDGHNMPFSLWVQRQTDLTQTLFQDPQVQALAQVKLGGTGDIDQALQTAADSSAQANAAVNLAAGIVGTGTGASSSGQVTNPFAPITLGTTPGSNGPQIHDAVELLKTALGIPPNLLVGGQDRPIGNVGDTAVTASLPNTIVVLTREILENRMKNGANWAQMQIDFQDQANVAQLGIDFPAHYIMYLQVERVP
jgi:hypothetical protein